MSVITLVCSCGMKMKAPGAVPGRVGKCPRCGSFLKVPGPPPDPPEGTSGPIPEASRAAPTTLVRSQAGRTRGRLPNSSSDGFVTPPRVAETRFVDSLSYPLWNASGIGLLIFMPPLLWLCTSPMFALASMLERGGLALFGVIFAIPLLLLWLAVGGYILIFLGRVLVTSAMGEVAQPRAPGWDLSEIGDGLSRWSWASIIGGVVGGLPATAYWITCGNIDWFDRIVLIDLIAPGMAYAQMALLASLIFETPLAANPITVTRAILRLGWAYLPPCLETAAFAVTLGGLFAWVLRLKDEVSQSVACLVFWMVCFYSSMVLLRRLGLFCFRNAAVLGWLSGRTSPSARTPD